MERIGLVIEFVWNKTYWCVFPLAAQEENCISSSVVQKYQGTIAKTKTNTTCLNWNSTELEKYITVYKLTFPGQYNFPIRTYRPLGTTFSNLKVHSHLRFIRRELFRELTVVKRVALSVLSEDIHTCYLRGLKSSIMGSVPIFEISAHAIIHALKSLVWMDHYCGFLAKNRFERPLFDVGDLICRTNPGSSTAHN